ncbi:MAG: hypothetical protein K6E20_04285 [Acholeplasmatales bacterium]|nr:hypothetical protein [Acholeplasmatales bacterium]
MKKILNMSFKLKFLLIYTLILIIGFAIFFVMGFKFDKWFNGWVIFGCITIIPNLFYFSYKAKLDSKGYHTVKRYSGKQVNQKPRWFQSLICIGVSICFGPAILLGSIIATLMGASI